MSKSFIREQLEEALRHTPVTLEFDADNQFNILDFVLEVIQSTYGDTVSLEQKRKILTKFGRNSNVTTAATGSTLWRTGVDDDHETYLANGVNTIDTISSSSASDTGAVKIEGHTDVGGEKTFVVQSATLNGQNKVTLTTPLNRMTRLYNDSNTDWVGTIYGYVDTAITAGKPTDTTKIHITALPEDNQSEKAATSLSSQDYWIITSIWADMLSKTGSPIADVSLQVRNKDKVFRTIYTFSTSTGGGSGQRSAAAPPIIIPPNSDVRLTATGSASCDVSGGIGGYLGIII